MSLNNPPAELLPGRYRHYKGPEYEVFGLVRHSETEEWLVHYRTLYGDFSHWVRPLTMFVETVELNGVTTPRFARIGDMDSQTDTPAGA
ncbi:DUF1653 domain-containing protein [Parathalassolituus penaei]|uniref:DUF1653 domain-containing protein n=1 Tax=Parathalassolituus penaei TaxID=2997323 RepID=A0A9X3EDF3_9GAMM|nr:DUF1653 domain-containing protein [Parathalassolituus penaei]MCY0964774.1 DUF1653 domain-containing protein [Parathalassolituus penaei]